MSVTHRGMERERSRSSSRCVREADVDTDDRMGMGNIVETMVEARDGWPLREIQDNQSPGSTLPLMLPREPQANPLVISWQ